MLSSSFSSSYKRTICLCVFVCVCCAGMSCPLVSLQSSATLCYLHILLLLLLLHHNLLLHCVCELCRHIFLWSVREICSICPSHNVIHKVITCHCQLLWTRRRSLGWNRLLRQRPLPPNHAPYPLTTPIHPLTTPTYTLSPPKWPLTTPRYT